MNYRTTLATADAVENANYVENKLGKKFSKSWNELIWSLKSTGEKREKYFQKIIGAVINNQEYASSVQQYNFLEENGNIQM